MTSRRNGFKIQRKFGAGKPTAENIFDEVLSLMRWGGGTATVYQEVLKLMQEDFQSKWNQMMENVVDNTEGNDWVHPCRKYFYVPSVDKTNLTTRLEDPDWFQDLSTNAKTKEEFMFRNCQSRIRGYFYRAESQIRKGNFFNNTWLTGLLLFWCILAK